MFGHLRLLRTAVVAVALAAVSLSSSRGRPAMALESPSAMRISPSSAEADIAGLFQLGDGRALYLECRGKGSPTVILQSGFGNAADIWSLAEAGPPAVAQGTAAFTRVCAYDRPGSFITTVSVDCAVAPAADLTPARSRPVPQMPRNPADVVEELHDLLAAANVPGPYVMVGHSLGGLMSLLYARTFPDEVAGLVTVDSPTPPFQKLLSPRLFELFRSGPLNAQSPVPGYRHEAYDLTDVYDQIESAPPLSPIPVVVLVRGEASPVPDPQTGLTAEDFAAIDQSNYEAQAEFAAAAPGRRLVVVPGTTHYIQTQRPDSVIEAIQYIIN